MKLKISSLGILVAVLATVFVATPQPALAASQKAKKQAADPDRPPASARPIYESIVIDANTGRVLHQVNADTPAYPASLTKMMTLYMLFEALEKGKMRLDTPLKVSQHAATQAPSKIDVIPGTTIAVEQAIYAIVTKSANDVAMVIAENLGGTEEHFCRLMTARARALGMTRSTFKNPNGLPNKGQISTARDMAILARHLMTDFPNEFAYFSKTEFPYRGVMIKGHNHFMENYDGADGLKTGYTFASGFNLAASAHRGDARLITVMFGGASAKLRDDHVASLMDAGFHVLQQAPNTIAVAQGVDPFPTLPAAPAAVAGAASTQTADANATNEDESAVAAGDADDAIARKIAAEARAPPLAATAALVPAPDSLGPKARAAAARVAAAEAAAVAPTIVAPPPNKSWGIQIGAFSNRLMAENQANAATEKLRTTYTSANARVVPVKVKNHQTLYRAQVVGLNRKDTLAACRLTAKLTQVGCKAVAPDQALAMR